jgi:hypothetical protein
MVAPAGPPWVSVSISGNVHWADSSTVIRVRNNSVGESSGTVIHRVICPREAPSGPGQQQGHRRGQVGVRGRRAEQSKRRRGPGGTGRRPGLGRRHLDEHTAGGNRTGGGHHGGLPREFRSAHLPPLAGSSLLAWSCAVANVAFGSAPW